ncbi:histidine kinase [Actinocrispum sp. NPDC049592]|uniref:sensor histidine kinase n=1 Tax=Actinocrispum sp. NPDC049592 TaxID=3154835 RepID=UPI003432E835
MRRELLGRWVVPIRVIPLVLAVGYILLLHEPLVPTGADWAFSMISTAAILVQGRWPLAVTLGQAALLMGAGGAWLAVGVINIATLFALGELAWRRGARQLWIGGTAVVLANLFQMVDPGQLVPELFRTVVLISAPVLLGLHLRSVQEIAWQAKERAAADAQAARADERTAIARELHDLVAHHVASMVLRIGVARHVLSPDPKVAQILDDVHASGKAAMADLRTLVTVLRDPEGGPDAVTDLPSALRAAVDRVEAAGPCVQAEIDPAITDLDAVLRLAVLRVVQEGLTNVLKHAGPQAKVMLDIRRDSEGVEVSLQDNGPGTPAAPGHGLIGMRERVELAGGRLNSGPAGDGWRVHARLPA